MAIEAELPDGRILEFPDGTDPGVIQSTVKRILASGPDAKQAPFSLVDTGLAAAQGVTGALKGVASAFGADNPVAEKLGSVQQSLGEAMSPERKAEQQRRAVLEQQAAKSGSTAQEIGAFLGGVKEAPIQSIAQGVGSAVPAIAAGLATVVAGAPIAIAGAVAVGARLLFGAVQGAGEVKGEIMDAVERELRESGMAPAEARRQAVAAQEYLGKNTANILGGAGLGAVASGTGVESVISKALAKKGATKAGESMLGRAVLEGGKEALPEGAQGGQSQYAQNVALSREGVDTPAFQGVLGAAARDAAVGALTGAAISPVGRRQEAPPAPQQDEPPAIDQAPKLPLATAPGAQGELFGPETAPKPAGADTDLFGDVVSRPKEEPAAEPSAVAAQPGQEDLGLDYLREIEQLYIERERLKQGAKTPESKARIEDLTTKIRQYEEMNIAEARAQTELMAARERADREAQVKFPALANAPDLWNASDAVRGRLQGDLFGEPGGPAPAAPQAADEEGQAPKGVHQYRLPLRSVPEGRNVRRAWPAAPGALTMKDVEDTGIAPSTTRSWFEENVVGKTRDDLQRMVDRDPSLVDGRGKRAKILRELLAPQPATFEESPNAQTSAETTATDAGVEPGAGEPSVGVSGESGVPDVAEPATGVAGPAGGATESDGLGLVPAGQPAGQGTQTQGSQPASVDEEAQRQREAAEVAAALAKVRGERPTQPAIAAPAAPKAAEPSQPIPEKLYEPVGTSEYGMEEGQKEILRGPQAMLFPMSKREEIAYAERPKAEGDLSLDEAPAAKDERQGELNFTPREDVAPVEAVKTATPSEDAVVKAIKDRPMLEVAQWAASNLPDSDQKVIAQRVLVKLRELQALGAELQQVKVTPEGHALLSGAKGVTIYKRGGAGQPSSISITLNHPSNGSQSGVTPEIILHELLHAATLGTIELGRKISAAGTKVGTASRELLALSEAVVNHFNARVNSGAQLTDFEQRVYKRYNNALRDMHEVLVWSLTNRDMQKYMESIPYKGQTAWNKFVTFVRDLLGIPAKADTALSEALRIGDTLLGMTKADIRGAEAQTGLQFAKSYSTDELVDLAGKLAPSIEKPAKKFVAAAAAGMEPSRLTKARTMVADYAATLESRFQKTFDGAVRDSLGKLNPLGLYRQAQDYTKILLEYFQTGTLVKDPSTGLYRATQSKDTPPLTDVFRLRDEWVKKHGLPLEQGRKLASKLVEGKRLQEILKENPDHPHPWDAADIAAAARRYDSDADLQAMGKAMDKPRIELVNHMVRVGRLSKEKGEEWKAVVGYVPFDRENIDGLMERFARAKKLTGKSPLTLTKDPELVGSFKRPVGDVFENYVNTMGWMVGQIMSNDARVQTLRSLEDLGFAEKPTRYLRPDAKDRSAEAFVGGEKMYWALPSAYDALAFKDVNPPKAGIVKAMSKFSNVLRKSVTTLPPFALKQVTDDVQRAIMTSGVKNPGALLRMSLANFGGIAFAELRGIQHPAVKDFGRLGITGEYDFEAGKPAESLLKDLGYKDRKALGSKKIGTLLHRLDGITRASDLAVRKAIYDQTIKETNDALLAQTRAREFINFRRRGASETIGIATATIPFFNAYVQGMDVLYRAASGKDSSSSIGRAQARKMFWSRALAVTTLSALYAFGKSDDDDYKEMDLRTRDGNWILPGGYKIPVPNELGAIFKVIPERAMEYWNRQGTPEEQTAWEATKTALWYMFEQYLGRTNPVPQAVKPLLEAWTNHSFLTGRELEGIYQKQQDPSMRRASNTSELAIQIAAFARDVVGVDKVSPILVDNALNGYFGSTAALLVAMTDSLLNPTRVDRPLHKWALVSNYMYDPVGTRRMTEFYEARETVGRANATLNELMKTDINRAAAYAESHASELALESAMNSTLEQLERTRAYRKFLNSPDGATQMPKDEREKELQELRKIEVGLTGWLREAQTALR